MALEFRVISLEKKDGFYIARIKFKDREEFKDREGDYEIFSNANIRYLDWITDENFRLSILDGMDEPFDRTNDEFPYIEIIALDSESKKYEKELEKAFFEFIKKGVARKRENNLKTQNC